MPVVAIDGPGGAGKSTLARELAGHLGLERLDTGAMYRAVTLAAIERGLDLGDGPELGQLAASMDLVVGDRVFADGVDVTEAIRSDSVNGAVSIVAAHPPVRQALVARQRAWVAERGGGIVEGRDIASVVLPDADLKIFLTASAAERAARRSAELSQSEPADDKAVAAALAHRDHLDSHRADSPLGVAPGAIVVDSTGREIKEILAEVLALL